MDLGDDTLFGIIFFLIFNVITLIPIIFGIKNIIEYKIKKEQKKLIFGILLLLFAAIIIVGIGAFISYTVRGSAIC